VAAEGWDVETVPFRDHFDASTSEADRAVLLSEWPGVLAGWRLTETLDSRAESQSPRLPVILDLLRKLFDRLKAGGLGDGEALARVIHSPLVGLLVGLSPNKADDMILDILKGLVPAP
jgi:hypothetical protein